MLRARILVLIIAASLLLSCSGIKGDLLELDCPTVRAELFFGLSISGGGEVTEGEWNEFARDRITPRFPEGLTVYEARGQWRNSDGTLSREGTKVVLIVTDNSREKFRLMDEIREAYRMEFRQESVMLVTSCAKAGF